jgi:hypothetical protein
MMSCVSGSIGEIDRASSVDSIKPQRLCIVCSQAPDKNPIDSGEPAGHCPDPLRLSGRHLVQIGSGDQFITTPRRPKRPSGDARP